MSPEPEIPAIKESVSLPIRVFISYAKEDLFIAERLYRDMQRPGIEPWFDTRDLRAGQRWRDPIKEAIRQSSYFICLLSNESVRKRGYVQKEIRHALDIAEEFPQDEVFIIPVRIDDCEPSHPSLRDLQWVDLFPSYVDGLNRLLQAFPYEPTMDQSKGTWPGMIVRLTDRGFGVIEGEKSQKDVFFSFRNFKTKNCDFVREGMHVWYSLHEGPIGLVATDIRLA